MSFQKPGSPFLYDDVTGDVIGLKDADGGETFFAAPRCTFAQMKALTGMADGQLAFVTNYPAGKGSNWRYSATLAEWFPVTPCKVFERTAVTDGVQQTAEQILQQITLEAGLLANKVFRLMTSFGKNGAVDTSTGVQVRLGTAGTTGDTSLFTIGSLVAANRSAGNDMWLRAASATSLEKLGGSPSAAFGGTVSSALIGASVTVANMTTQQLIMSLTTTMGGTTDKPQLGYVALEIQP